jgi:hypothetical protein
MKSRIAMIALLSVLSGSSALAAFPIEMSGALNPANVDDLQTQDRALRNQGLDLEKVDVLHRDSDCEVCEDFMLTYQSADGKKSATIEINYNTESGRGAAFAN